jgi:predicted transcriptional regulator
MNMTIKELRTGRIAAGVSGRMLCLRARVDRTKLSHYEQNYLTPKPEEMLRLEKALDELISAKQRVASYAMQVGWPAPAL